MRKRADLATDPILIRVELRTVLIQEGIYLERFWISLLTWQFQQVWSSLLPRFYAGKIQCDWYDSKELKFCFLVKESVTLRIARWQEKALKFHGDHLHMICGVIFAHKKENLELTFLNFIKVNSHGVRWAWLSLQKIMRKQIPWLQRRFKQIPWL